MVAFCLPIVGNRMRWQTGLFSLNKSSFHTPPFFKKTKTCHFAGQLWMFRTLLASNLVSPLSPFSPSPQICGPATEIFFLQHNPGCKTDGRFNSSLPEFDNHKAVDKPVHILPLLDERALTAFVGDGQLPSLSPGGKGGFVFFRWGTEKTFYTAVKTWQNYVTARFT